MTNQNTSAYRSKQVEMSADFGRRIRTTAQTLLDEATRRLRAPLNSLQTLFGRGNPNAMGFIGLLYWIRRIDGTYFGMGLRTASSGPRVGRQIFGQTGFGG